MIRISPNTAEKIVNGMHLEPEEYEILREQLNTPNYHNDLLEKITNLIMGSDAKRYIGSGYLERLRALLLRPSEWSRVQAMSKAKFTCVNCSRVLGDNEIMTYRESGNVIYCLSCLTPTMAPCAKCGTGNITISNSQMKALAKIRNSSENCDRCHGTADEEPAPADTLDTAALRRLRQQLNTPVTGPTTAAPRGTRITDTVPVYRFETAPTATPAAPTEANGNLRINDGGMTFTLPDRVIEDNLWTTVGNAGGIGGVRVEYEPDALLTEPAPLDQRRMQINELLERARRNVRENEGITTADADNGEGVL